MALTVALTFSMLYLQSPRQKRTRRAAMSLVDTHFTCCTPSALLTSHKDSEFIIVHFPDKRKLNSDDLTYVYSPTNLSEPDTCHPTAC